jgi:hypothetical protein
MGYQDGDCTREPTRTIDDAVDEVEASGIQKKPGEKNGFLKTTARQFNRPDSY